MKKKKFTGKWIVPISKEFLFDTNLSLEARFVYIVLKSFVNNTTIEAFPSIEYLCSITGFTNKTVQKYTRELIQKKVIAKRQVKVKGKFSHNVYSLQNEKATVGKNLPYGKKTVTQNSYVMYNNLLSNNNESKSKKEKKHSLTTNQQKEKIYLDCVVRLFMHYSGKEKSSAYALVHKLLKLKAEDKLSYLRKCIMLIYVIKLNVEKVNDPKFVGVLVNQYRELSYNIVKDCIERQREISNELETFN